MFASSLPLLAADEAEIEEIVVTGSYIPRQLEEMSTPTDVLDRTEFEDQGSPTMVEIVQNIPVIKGSINRSEQYTSGGVITGLKNINIRNLGMGRTLVLLNGKRPANANAGTNSGEYAVDVGNFPNIALQRIELLKNGGSTTYGTDAMAGVFNFITRDEFEGAEFRIAHGDINNSDGDNEIGMIFGFAGGDVNWVTSIEWQERNPLLIVDAHQEVDPAPLDGSWPMGFTTMGNPGSFLPAAETGGMDWAYAFRTGGLTYEPDPLCGMNVGQAGSFAVAGDGRCGFYYSDFTGVIEPQKRYKIYNQVKLAIGDRVEGYGEVMYARLESVYYGSPTYPPTMEIPYPWASTATIIHPDNPGLLDFINTMGAGYDEIYQFGAIGVSRAWAIEGPVAEMPRTHENWHTVMGLRGDLTDSIAFDFSGTYSTTVSNIDGQDILTANFARGNAGLGGPACTPVSDDPMDPANDALRGDAASGCYWWNPFASSINAAVGSALDNSEELRQDMIGESSGITEKRQYQVDAVFDGEAPLQLSGGNVAWAAGAQWRYFNSLYDPTGYNRAATPTAPNPFHFLTTQLKDQTEFKRWALFGELYLPVTDNLAVDLGLRHEDYEEDSVTKPRIAARWDATDWLTVRASFEQTFIVPIIRNQPGRSLQKVGNEYITIEVPIPAALDPEESNNFNFGILLNPMEGLRIGLDYYKMELRDAFSTESISSGTPVLNDNGNTIKIITEEFNGGGVDIAGLDFTAEYQWDVEFGSFDFGANGTLALEYDVLDIDGSFLYDALGKYNYLAAPVVVRSMPEMHMNAWVGLLSGAHTARLYARYIDSYKVADPGLATIEPTVDSWTTLDLHYTFSFLENEQAQIALSMINLTNESPPLSPHEAAYDAFTHSPVGRIIKLAFTYTLER
jgi:outer membrane receptor protein involved in Fe transport|tara:strand:+ start:998 stop:3706 length:2709 start_codon:yes stop_codon:yes gene_type:complete